MVSSRIDERFSFGFKLGEPGCPPFNGVDFGDGAGFWRSLIHGMNHAISNREGLFVEILLIITLQNK